MRKLFVFVIIALFSLAVFAFAQSPTVYAEGEITTVSEEITTEITTVDEPLSEEDIAAIIEAAGISELVAQAWEGLPQSVKTILGLLGITSSGAALLAIAAGIVYIGKRRKTLGIATQSNARLGAILGFVKSFSNFVNVAFSTFGAQSAVLAKLLPTITYTAEATQLLIAASSNDDIRALKAKLNAEYNQATGQLPADFNTQSDSEKLAAAAKELMESVNAIRA